MKKYALIPIAAAFILLTGCNFIKPKQQAPVQEVIQVKAEPAAIQEIPSINEFTATVQANIVNNIAPAMNVRIEKIFVEVGDYVKAGQTLVQMDNSNLKQAKSQLDNMELSFSRIDELYKVGGVSRAEWDAQKMNLDVMRTSYKNLVDNTQLLSPINGIVSTRNYDSGDLYTMGRPVLIVEQIAPVKLMVNVSEQFFTKVRKGMPVDIALDVYPGEKFSGKVSLVYPTITAATHTFPVEISIPNLQNKVRPGMFARVTIDFGAQTGIVIPDRSIIKQQGSGERYVFVYKEGKAEYRTVVLGRRLDTKYECTSGVEEGDLVITIGLNRLTSGAEVELVK